MNISIAIVDLNKDYMKRLSEVLQQYDELTISAFTSVEKFQEIISRKQFDVVLFDPDVSEETLTFSGVKLPVCLYSDEACNAYKYMSVAKIMKYQRISTIYKEVIRQYAEKAGYSANFDHSQNTTVVAVYSPVGGSGKTTVALAVASQIVNQGKKVLFISAEQLNSSFGVNPKEEDGIVALAEAAADEHVNFELKLKGIIKQGFNGVSYVEGFERFADYDAVTGSEMRDILNNIRRCGICDVLMVDMESNLDEIGREIMDLADRIIIVEKPGELPLVKMGLFEKQAFVNEYKNKMVQVCNFAENNTKYSTQLNLPVIGTVHNYGNLQLKNMIQAINRNGEIMLDKIVRK